MTMRRIVANFYIVKKILTKLDWKNMKLIEFLNILKDID